MRVTVAASPPLRRRGKDDHRKQASDPPSLPLASPC